MSSEVKIWWSDNKIDWYERAASFTDFHKRLAYKLSLIIPKNSSIIEIGCGLGYLAYELFSLGYDLSAYDIDSRIIERARSRTGLDIYHVANCYSLNKSCFISIPRSNIFTIGCDLISSSNSCEKIMKSRK